MNATELKNRLGATLDQAVLEPVAIERHGRVVAWLVPASSRKPARKTRCAVGLQAIPAWTREREERVLELCARGDFRPSRWLRAGDSRTLAGIATMLASEPQFDRMRMLALAERLHSGMSTPEGFGSWLATTPVEAARILPTLGARIRGSQALAELERNGR
ncbi:MAG: hypothetical protein ABIS68_07495 [Casimicrobiaceae bacterium]